MSLPRLHWFVFPLALACLVVAQEPAKPRPLVEAGSRPNLIGLEPLTFNPRPGDALEVFGNHTAHALRLTLMLRCAEGSSLFLGTREIKLGPGSSLRAVDIAPGEILLLRPMRDDAFWSVKSLVEI